MVLTHTFLLSGLHREAIWNNTRCSENNSFLWNLSVKKIICGVEHSSYSYAKQTLEFNREKIILKICLSFYTCSQNKVEWNRLVLIMRVPAKRQWLDILVECTDFIYVSMYYIYLFFISIRDKKKVKIKKYILYLD